MLKGILGKKVNMDRRFDSHGRAVSVTNILVEPNHVVLLREKEKEGYKAAQVGFGSKKRLPKPVVGQLKKAGIEKNISYLREISFDGELKPGQEVRVEEVLRKGGLVDVVGISKGKGFAGGVKRHGFHGGPKTHGQSDRHRAPGSIGSGTTPGRVFKGTRMAGHMGADRITIHGLQIMEIDKENNLVVIKGSVPGARGSTLLLKKSIKKAKAYHEPEEVTAPVVGGKDEETEEKIETENAPEAKVETAEENKESNDGNQG